MYNPNALLEFMKVFKLSKIDLAERIGVTWRSVHNWSKGGFPNSAAIEALCEMAKQNGYFLDLFDQGVPENSIEIPTPEEMFRRGK